MLYDVINKIDELAKLEDNWDSYGAKKLSTKTIQNTKEIVGAFFHVNLPHTIVPTNHDSILLGWDGEERTIEIDEESLKIWPMAKIRRLKIEFTVV